jgi:Tol biopolymer transport system component
MSICRKTVLKDATSQPSSTHRFIAKQAKSWPLVAGLFASLLAGSAASQAQEKIAFTATSFSSNVGSINTVNTTGTDQKITINGTQLANADISPDGKKIVYQNGTQIFVFDLTNNNIQQLTTSTDFRIAQDPVWSPNGTQIAFEGVKAGNNTLSHIFVMTVSTKQWRQVTGTRDNPNTAVNPPTAPDVVGTTENTKTASNEIDPSWSPNGAFIVFSTDRHYMTNPGTGLLRTNSEIYYINVATLAETRVTVIQGSNFEVNPDWSPGGTKILFETASSGIRRIGEISKTPATFADITFLTNNTQGAVEGTYSPDGTRIAFSRDKRIYTLRAAPEGSSNLAQPVTTTAVYARQPAWGRSAPIVTPTPSPRTIRGKVFLNTIGMGGVNVFLVGNNNFAALYGSAASSDIRRVTTLTSPSTAIGEFSFTNVPPGSYHVVVLKQGNYFNPVSKLVTVSTADVNGVNFTQSGADATAPTVTVTAPAVGTFPSVASASGTVNDTGGSGVQAVILSLYRLGTTSNEVFNWGTNAYVTGTSQDPRVFKLATLSGDKRTWSVSFPSPSLSVSGRYRLSVLAIDNAYRVSTPVNREFTIGTSNTTDTTKPTGSITAPISGTSSSFAAVRGTAADSGGLHHVKLAIVRRLVGTTSTQYQFWNGTSWTTIATLPNSTTVSPAQIATVLLPYLSFADTRLPRVPLTGTSASWSYPSVPTGNGTYYVAAAVNDKAGNYTILPGAPNYLITVNVQATTDTTNPTGSLTSPISGTSSTFAAVRGTASDSGGLHHTKLAIVRRVVGTTSTQFQFWNGTIWTTVATLPNSTTVSPAQIASLLLPYLSFADTRLPRVPLTGTSATWSYPSVPSGNGTYYVAAAVYDKAGNYTILPGAPNYLVTINVQTATTNGPPNDSILKAQAITGNSGTVKGTNVGATRESFEPNHVPPSSNNTIWYRWTAAANGSVTFDVKGSAILPIITPYTGSTSSLTGLTHRYTNNTTTAQYSITFNVTAGQTYFIVVAGSSSATGAITLNWAASSSPVALSRTVATTSSAAASAAADTVSINLTAPLNTETAEETTPYSVSVNGNEVEVESASYNAATGAVTLYLPEGSLQAGDNIVVKWSNLRTQSGTVATGETSVIANN